MLQSIDLDGEFEKTLLDIAELTYPTYELATIRYNPDLPWHIEEPEI